MSRQTNEGLQILSPIYRLRHSLKKLIEPVVEQEKYIKNMPSINRFILKKAVIFFSCNSPFLTIVMTRLLAHKEEEKPWRHEFPINPCDTSAGGLIRYQASD